WGCAQSYRPLPCHAGTGPSQGHSPVFRACLYRRSRYRTQERSGFRQETRDPSAREKLWKDCQCERPLLCHGPRSALGARGKGLCCHGIGQGKFFPLALAAIQASYEKNETDEFILPAVITDDRGQPWVKEIDGAGLFYFNFRPDRCRELLMALTDPNFSN